MNCGWLLDFYVLTTSKGISAWIATFPCSNNSVTRSGRVEACYMNRYPMGKRGENVSVIQNELQPFEGFVLKHLDYR